MAVQIFKDAAAGTVFFKGSSATPIPCNVGLAYAHPSQTNRIIIERTDVQKRDGSNRTVFKRLKFTRVQDKDGTQISNTDRQAVIDYLNGVLQEAESTDVAASYKGGWNATTNTPNITGSAGVNGDWYFVSTSGSIDLGSGSLDFLVNDVVKFVSRSDNTSEWERIPNETVRVDELDSEIDSITSNSSLTQFDFHVDANYIGGEQLGTAIKPFKTIFQAISASDSSTPSEILLNGEFVITASLNITGNKKIHLTGTEGTKIKYSSYNQANGDIITYIGTDYTGELTAKNITFENAGGFAVNIISSSRIDVGDCNFSNNGWSGNGLSLTSEESGSILGYNSPTSSLQTFYASECSEGGAMYIANCGIVEITDNSISNNNKGLEIVDSGFIGTTEAFGFIARNKIYKNVSIGLDLESSTGDALGGNQNFNVYNNAINYNGDTGVKIEGGLNNALALGVSKGNWNSAIELSHVGNAKIRDLDLDNNNRAGVDAEGDQANGLATIHIEGDTLNPNATFIADIFNTQILNTQLGSNSVKCGVIIDASVGNHSGQNAIIKFDNLTFMNQDYALDFVANLDNIEVIVGDCEYVNTSIQTIRTQGGGRYLELPFTNFTVDVPYLDFSVDRISKTISLKDGPGGKTLNNYPINSIKSIIQGSRIDIIQTNSNKIQLRGLSEGRVYKDGNLISGSLNDVNNAINAAFTETLPTVFTPTTTLVTNSSSISVFGTGSETGITGSYYTGSDGGFNHGFVLTTDNALTSSGEFYTFTINTEGIIGMGFNKSGSTGIYTSESIGTGVGGAERGYYWSTWFHPTPDGPWAYYGESAANTTLLSGWYNFDDSDSGADWLNGEDVTMKAGIDNDGYPYLSYYSSNAGGYVPIARDGNTVPYDCEFNLLIKFGDENAKVSNVMLHHQRELTSEELTYYAVESPDGVWYYPMFLTEEEANWFDSNIAQPAGAGTSEEYNFVDDPQGNTYFIPSSGSSTGSTVHPTGSYLSGTTFNYVVTENDDLYAPSGFGNVTITLNEGATLNQQVIAPGQTNTVTLVNPPSWISLSGYNAVGTAPDVLLDNITVPSASYDVTVRTSNAYGFTDGTLTVKVLNTTTNASLPGTIYQGTFLSEADYNNDYGTSFVTSVNRDALVVTTGSGENGAVYDLPYPLDDGDSYEWPFTAYLNFGIVSESVDKTGSDIVNITNFNSRFDLLFSNRVNGNTLQFSRPTPRADGNYNELEAVGWDNNTYRDFPGGPHATTFNAVNPKDMFKLYNNAGRIELSYDINDGNGYQLFASSSELYGTGSDAPTITAVAPTSFTVDYVTLPSITYTANGASAPNGFSIVNGTMDTSLLLNGNSAVAYSSETLSPGQRFIIPKTWVNTNVLPYIDGDDNVGGTSASDNKVFVGVPKANPNWNSVTLTDFFAVHRIENQLANSTKLTHFYSSGSNNDATTTINSDTEIIYDLGIDFSREGNISVLRLNPSTADITTQPIEGGTFTNIKTWEGAYNDANVTSTGTGSLELAVATRASGTRVRLVETGLSVQRSPLPTRQYDVVEDTSALPLFKRYNETDVTFGGLTLNAGETYKFWLHDSSIESTDLLSFVSASDSSSAITQGITSSGTPGTFGSYLEFNVPSDVQPLKVAWTTGGVFTTGSVSIAGSTYVQSVTGITQEGPAANQTGTNLFDVGDFGWLSVDETLSAGERLVMSTTFLADLVDAMPDNSFVKIGLKGTGWATTTADTNFEGALRLVIERNSSTDVDFRAWSGASSTTLITTTVADITSNNIAAILEITSSGNNIRFAIRSDTNNNTNTTSATTYADWDSSYKVQTGDQNYGITSTDVMILGKDSSGGANVVGMDTADVNWTRLSEINVPTAPTILTNWTKAIDFSGGNEHMEMVAGGSNYNPMMMGGTNNQVSAPTAGQTVSNGHPWATAIVFNADGNSSNQHIWNLGEGGGNTDDNIYLRLDASSNLYFGWGRSGDFNECKIMPTHVGSSWTLTTGNWYGIYIGHNGTRYGSGNTATQMAAAFDIRLMGSSDSFGSLSSNLSLTVQSNGQGWGTVGGRMNRQYQGSLTIGGRGSNRNFHGKVASFLTTTLKVGVSMPDATEIEMMITDPTNWIATYKSNNTFRQPNTSTGVSNWNNANVSTRSTATQLWLMGDGTFDSYSNMIRNQVYPGDQNNTKMNMISMASNDIETVNISGLS